MKSDNRGVTLIELIVVMLIIGILAGGAFMGVQSLDSGKALSSVKRINALLDYVRIQNMSKNKEYYLILEEAGGAYYARIQTREDNGGVPVAADILKEKLKLKGGSIMYYSKASSDISETSHMIDCDVIPSVSLEISFEKESGALRISSDNKYVKRITVIAAGRSYTINLVAMTGKHYIE